MRWNYKTIISIYLLASFRMWFVVVVPLLILTYVLAANRKSQQ